MRSTATGGLHACDQASRLASQPTCTGCYDMYRLAMCAVAQPRFSVTHDRCSNTHDILVSCLGQRNYLGETRMHAAS